MNKCLNFFILIFLYFFVFSHQAQDGPRDLTITNQKTLEEDNEKIQKFNDPFTEENNFDLLDENQSQSDDNINQKLIIDDIPKEFNNWYGVLSSKDGGLGWLMWGETDYKLSLQLLKNLPKSMYLSSALELYTNLLLSRAQSPELLDRKKKNSKINIIDNSTIQYQYLDEKIRLMIGLGIENKIKYLASSIPLETRNNLFKKRLEDIRFENADINFICQNVQEKLNEEKNKTFYRKILISCNIAKNKVDEALLAIDLLENDTENENLFFKIARNVIEDKIITIKELEQLKYPLNLILALRNKTLSIEIFYKKKIQLDKLIYKMELFEKSDRLEALERLVNLGIYDAEVLKNDYLQHAESIKNNISKTPNFLEANTIDGRSYLFSKINKSQDENEISKNLKLLWNKGREKGLEKALSLVTLEAIDLISPENKLSWLVLPTSKNLLLSNKLEKAKKWLFYGQIDPKERASLDPNFCKLLILFYLKDKDFYLEEENLPNINFLLDILVNDINTDRTYLERLIISLKANNFDIKDDIWKTFIFDVNNNKNTNKYQKFGQSLLFHLDYVTRKKNKAEVAIISIILLSNYLETNNLNYLFYSLNALEKVGLKKYAQEIAFEINADFLK